MKHENVVILGASANAGRYSNQALHLLQSYGHSTFPVNPGLDEIDGQPCYRNLAAASSEAEGEVDTLTMYVNAKRSSQLADQISAISPRRVIFNPGAENPELAETLRKLGCEVLNACTLVLLRTNQF